MSLNVNDQERRLQQLTRKVEALSLRPYTLDIISPFVGLPGLVGFWPMSSIDRSSGDVYDVSGQGRTLTYTGNPTYSYTDQGAPYINLDGTGDYLARADETDLDIVGTETIHNSTQRGLTMGGWVYWDTAGSPGVTNRPMMSKEPSASICPYSIFLEDASTQRCIARIADTDSALSIVEAATTAAVDLNTWHFAVLRFRPGSAIDLYFDGVLYTTSTSKTAIYSSTGAFEIGRGFATQVMDGRVSLAFLSSAMLSTNILSSLYQRTRGSFGV